MPRLKNKMKEQRLTFIKFSRIEKAERTWWSKKDGRKMWSWCSIIYDFYRCKCGAVTEKQRRAVKSGNTRSCGCLNRETGTQNLKKAYDSGFRGTPPKNWNNCNFKNGKKNTAGGRKGKVFIPDFPGKLHSTGRYVTVEEANLMTIAEA